MINYCLVLCKYIIICVCDLLILFSFLNLMCLIIEEGVNIIFWCNVIDGYLIFIVRWFICEIDEIGYKGIKLNVIKR